MPTDKIVITTDSGERVEATAPAACIAMPIRAKSACREMPRGIRTRVKVWWTKKKRDYRKNVWSI